MYPRWSAEVVTWRPASGCYYIICGDPLGIGRQNAPVFPALNSGRARAIGAGLTGGGGGAWAILTIDYRIKGAIRLYMDHFSQT
jgi:hypothetical protein